jgi:hypothetical protein
VGESSGGESFAFEIGMLHTTHYKSKRERERVREKKRREGRKICVSKKKKRERVRVRETVSKKNTSKK